MLEIIEVKKRFDKGITKPFLCKCCDGKLYVVKTTGTLTKKEIIAEYVCARLAVALNLPIPPCKIVYIPYEIENLLQEEWKDDMNEGYAFASEFISDASIATYRQAHNCSIEIQKKIYIFDRLIQNSDRTCTKENVGNINLLYSISEKKVFIIDHNLAFMKKLCANEFLDHVYAPHSQELDLDLIDSIDFPEEFKHVVEKIDDILKLIPEEWYPESGINDCFNRIRMLLGYINDPDFLRNL